MSRRYISQVQINVPSFYGNTSRIHLSVQNKSTQHFNIQAYVPLTYCKHTLSHTLTYKYTYTPAHSIFITIIVLMVVILLRRGIHCSLKMIIHLSLLFIQWVQEQIMIGVILIISF